VARAGFLLASSCLAACSALGRTDARRPVRPARFPAESGRVAYRATAPGRHGTAILTWMGWGDRFRYEARYRMEGEKSQPFSWSYWCLGRGSELFLRSTQRGPEIVRMRLPREAPGLAVLTLTVVPVPPDVGTAAGTGMILDRACRIRTIPRARLWIHEGLPMRIELQRPDSPVSSLEAVGINLSHRPKSETFELPRGVKIVDSKVPGLAPKAGRE